MPDKTDRTKEDLSLPDNEQDMDDELLQADDSDSERFEHHRFEVDPGQGLLRIDKYLSLRLPNTSRNKIQIAADGGAIRVDGKAVKANYKVKPGEIITIELTYPRREIEIIPEAIPLNIVYEDDALVVVNKAPNMVVHPSFGHYNGTLVNALAYHLKDAPVFQAADMRPGLVHRIDKNTSGLLVVAKTEIAKQLLSKQFFYKTAERRYVALVWGNFEEEQGTVNGHIGRNLRDRKVMAVFPDGSHGKPAITHYRVLERFGYTTLIECRLETGRTHQIRAHMAYIRHPLFNDWEYGGDQILKGTTFTKYKQFVQNCFKLLPRQALHAKTLGFEHPVSRQQMTFDSPIPEDLAAVIDKWRHYAKHRLTDEE